MTEKNHDRFSSAFVEAIGGLSAGTISTLIVHPLDIIKTRLQIHRSTSTSPASGFSILQSLLRNKQPIQSLYRGLSPNLVGNASSWAIFFYFKSLIEKQLLILHQPSQPGHQNTLTPADYFVAAGIAGAATTLSTSPIWVLKTRMLSSDRGSKGAYENMWHGIQHIWREDGPRGFYRGAAVSLLGVSHGAVQFAVYEPLKTLWRRHVSRRRDGIVNTEDVKLGSVATVALSSSAKIVAGTATYPYQVLRSRLQTYDAELRFGRGISGVAARVWREDGWKGFYRGLGMNIVRVLPATWVTFLVYENARYFLSRWDREERED